MDNFTPIDRRPEIESRLASMSPESRVFIDHMRKEMDEENRIYKMHLSAVREAGHLTQTDIAKKLGKPASNISRTEHAADMLFSTLLAYLEAAGAKDVSLLATVGGKRVEVGLAGVA